MAAYCRWNQTELSCLQIGKRWDHHTRRRIKIGRKTRIAKSFDMGGDIYPNRGCGSEAVCYKLKIHSSVTEVCNI